MDTLAESESNNAFGVVSKSHYRSTNKFSKR